MKAGKPTRFLRPLLEHWRETPVSQITAGAIRQAALTIYPDATGATRNRAVITPAQAVINHAAESRAMRSDQSETVSDREDSEIPGLVAIGSRRLCHAPHLIWRHSVPLCF